MTKGLAAPGYTIRDTLYRGHRSVVVRAVDGEGRPVVIKTPAESRPSRRELARYQRAWALGRIADSSAVVRHVELLRVRSTVALVVEDMGGTSLDKSIPRGGMRPRELLELGVSLASAVGRLHDSGVLHRDLKPANVIARPDGEVRLIDLGAAAKVNDADCDGTPEGTLAYMPPEQSGRIHGRVDERSDLYSLGCALFELATGRVPFDESDPGTLVHAHVARPPPRLGDLRPDLPPILSKIVDRLLRKNAEERYATAHGLAYDLRRCVDEMQRSGAVRDFELGEADRSSRFRIPDKLYGRERELDRLDEAIAAFVDGQRVSVSVAGHSGIGKTALVAEVRRRLALQSVVSCAGKFDQYRSELPYLGVLIAVRELMRRELTRPEAELEARREEIQEKVGIHGALLTQAIPELQAILGPQPEVEEAAPLDARRRFHRLASRFLSVFATADRPLVLFVDDLQWADPPSLQLLEALARDPALDRLLIITGHRSNELGPGHPARETLDVLAAACDVTEALELGPLETGDVANLVADTVHLDVDDVALIAERIASVSGGNPFFVREYLGSLRREGFFKWNERGAAWSWDAGELSQQVVPDNVAELLTLRLADLPRDCLDLLDTASCVGSEFDLRTLADVHQIAQELSARGIAPAVERGLVVPLDDGHRVFESLAMWSTPPEHGDRTETARYRFQHDRVRQTVHERLDDAHRAQRHLQIGRLLLRTLTAEELSQRLVEVFDHVVYGIDLVADPGERLALAETGLRAGQSAAQALAFDTALRMIDAATALLPDDAWDSAYDTTVGLYMLRAGCDHALARYETSEEAAEQVIRHARSVMDAARAQGLRVRTRATQTRYAEAVDVGVTVAGELGVRLPRKPGLPHVLWGVAQTLWAQGRRDPMDFEGLSDAQDPRVVHAVALLSQTAASAYFAEPNLLPLVGMAATRLSIKHGMCPQSPYGFAVWALVLCGVLDRIENGYRFGLLAAAVGRRYGGLDEARARLVVDAFVRHYCEPLEDCARRLYGAWAYNRDAGDEESATYAVGALVYTEFLIGAALDAPERYDDMVQFLVACQVIHSKDCFLAWVQLFHAMREPELPETLSGPLYDHRVKLPVFEETQNFVQMGISSVAAGILDQLAGRLDGAREHFERAASCEDSLAGQATVPALAFFRALNAYERVLEDPSRRRELRLARAQHKRVRMWARHAPFTHDHRIGLLDALEALVRGRPAEALVALHRADTASGSGALYRGLARTWMVRVHQQLGNADAAHAARVRARDAFVRWGCPALADAALPPQALTQSLGSTHSTSTSGRVHLGQLDLEVFLEAVGAISGEIDHNRLIGSLMRTVLEASGADRGLLFLLLDGRRIVAEVELREGGEVETRATPLEELTRFARPIFELARRSSGSVVVHDAARDELLRDDAYAHDSGVRAILATPIALRGTALGWLYLENHMAPGAFTKDRVTITEALAAQAGIALENARLYGRVQAALAEQTALTEANRRFVPQQFLAGLGVRSIVDVELNVVREREMSVLFVDLRGFSKLSLELGPRGTVEMINRYLAFVQPGIAANGGFVGQYYGDGVLALFPDEADNALLGAVAMCRGLERYNARLDGFPPLDFGMGLHSGKLTLGTIGDPDHFQCGVVGDSVNLASRMEGLTKHFGATLVLSGATRERVERATEHALRPLGRVEVAGRPEAIDVYECVDCYPTAVRDRIMGGLDAYEAALDAWTDGRWDEAKAGFSDVAARCPEDRVAHRFVDRCARYATRTDPWDGVERPAKGKG